MPESTRPHVHPVDRKAWIVSVFIALWIVPLFTPPSIDSAIGWALLAAVPFGALVAIRRRRGARPGASRDAGPGLLVEPAAGMDRTRLRRLLPLGSDPAVAGPQIALALAEIGRRLLEPAVPIGIMLQPDGDSLVWQRFAGYQIRSAGTSTRLDDELIAARVRLMPHDPLEPLIDATFAFRVGSASDASAVIEVYEVGVDPDIIRAVVAAELPGATRVTCRATKRGWKIVVRLPRTARPGQADVVRAGRVLQERHLVDVAAISLE